MITRCILPDELRLPDGTVLKPEIGGHVDNVPFLTQEHSGVDVTRNGWGNDLIERGDQMVIRESKRRKLKYRRVTVLSRNLRGKLDLYGKHYQGTQWVFVEVKKESK